MKAIHNRVNVPETKSEIKSLLLSGGLRIKGYMTDYSGARSYRSVIKRILIKAFVFYAGIAAVMGAPSMVANQLDVDILITITGYIGYGALYVTVAGIAYIVFHGFKHLTMVKTGSIDN
jgi:hypothetical protein